MGKAFMGFASFRTLRRSALIASSFTLLHIRI